MRTAAVIVASDSRSRSVRQDETGPLAQRLLEELGLKVLEVAVVPDEREQLGRELERLCDQSAASLVLTCGGTGLAPRDVTPEATRDVMEREAPGIAQLLRLRSLEITPKAALGRGIAGTRGRSLIVNLPGSPKAVRESIEILAPILDHALETLAGEASECAS